MILVGNIDVKKSELALFDEKTDFSSSLYAFSFSTQEYTRVEHMLIEFKKLPPVEKLLRNARINVLVLGVAGPVEKSETFGAYAKLTNVPRLDRIRANPLAAELGIPVVTILNDMETLAHGIVKLPPSDFFSLTSADTDNTVPGNAVLIAATGFGLGEAFLEWDEATQSYSPMPLEGGHIDFAPRDEQEIRLLEFFRKFHSQVSYERILSYPGLQKIYGFLTGREPETLSADEIIRKTLDGSDPQCAEAVDIFLSIYGAKAGNLAVQRSLAINTVYLAGELTTKILPRLPHGSFIQAFAHHGQENFKEKLSTIHVRALRTDSFSVQQRGLAQYAVQFLDAATVQPGGPGPYLAGELSGKPLEFDGSYSFRIFIGRLPERALITRIIYGLEEQYWILHLLGEGGIGKTMLLEFAQRLAEERGILITKQLIDFYFPLHQTELGILKTLVDQLGPKYFKNFSRILETVQATPHALESSREAFISDYSNLPTDHIVLLFDTTERLSPAAKRFFLETLPRLKDKKPRTSVITAGRQPITELFSPEENTVLSTTLKEHTVARLAGDDIKDYLSYPGLDVEISEPAISRLVELSNGRPILIALFIDLVKYKLTSAEELLSELSVESFEKTLVERIRRLNSPVDIFILAIAHCHRRCNNEILLHLYPNYKAELETVLSELRRFSFVKYRQFGVNTDSILLHDEMYRLVEKYIWRYLDPVGNQRQYYSKKLVEYYRKKLTEAPEPQEGQPLQQDCLYYQLHADFDAGVKLWREFIQCATHPDNKDAIQQEIACYLDQHPDLKPESSLYKADICFERAQYQEYIQLAESLLKTSPELASRIYHHLLYSYINSGNFFKAAELSHSLLVDQKHSQHFADAHSALGYVSRKKGDYTAAIQHYEEAIKCYGGSVLEQEERATTENNLGFILHRLGRDSEALAHCNAALRLRQKMSNLYTLGLSYNVLGIIEADNDRRSRALYYFNRALDCFDRAGSRRGKALVYLARGKMQGDLAYDEYFAAKGTDSELFEEANRHFDQAIDLLSQAVAIFSSTDHSNLPEALNEKGRALRNCARLHMSNPKINSAKILSLLQSALSDFGQSKQQATVFENHFLVVKNVKDEARAYQSLYVITQDNMKLKKAQTLGEQGLQLLEEKKLFSIYIKSRLQQVMADVFFARKDYENTFKYAADSVLTLCRKDGGALDQTDLTPARRNVLYIYWQEWITELLLLLTYEDRENYSQYTRNKWQETLSLHSEEFFASLLNFFMENMP